MEQVMEIKQVAENAAREAGAYVAEHLNKLKDISYKGGINNLVTDVDLASYIGGEIQAVLDPVLHRVT